MMLISKANLQKYLNQTASLEAKSGVDRYGNQSYTKAVLIPVRSEGKIRLVRNIHGEQVVSNTTVFSTTQILPLDKIDGNEVINVSEMVNREGEVIGWECYL